MPSSVTDRLPLLALLVAGVVLAPAVGACEPIIPLFMVLAGPGALAKSLAVLLVAVVFKAGLYAWLLRKRAPGNAFVFMVAGNVVSTVVGFFAAAIAAGIPLTGLLGIAVCAIVPARRLAALYPRINQTMSTFGIVFFMTALVFGSMMLWAISQSALKGHEPLAIYWALKIAFVFVGLLCGLVITVFWEEWTIWRLSGRPEVGGEDLKPIVVANLVTIGLVALYAAAVMLPKRLASSNFLVDLLRSVFAA